MAYTNLEKFHFWCQKVLPLVYDDSLSYYEVLCKVVKYLNTTIEAVNDLAETITNYDELIQKLNETYEGMQAELTALTTTVNDNYTTLKGLIDDTNSAIDALKAELQAEIDTNVNSIDLINATLAVLKTADATLQDNIDELANVVNLNYADLDSKITVLSQEVHNGTVLAELRTMVKELQEKMDNLTYDVYNYVLDKRISFDTNNYIIYQHMGNALTAQQYCELNLSADDYAKFGIQAIDYIKFSRDLLRYDWVYLPITGGKQTHSIGLDLLSNYMYDTMSASEYSALDLDADGYGELGLTSYQYLYYPISDDVALNPLQYVVTLNENFTNELANTNAELEKTNAALAETNANLETTNNNIIEINADLQAQIDALKARVVKLELVPGTVEVSETGSGISALSYAKLGIAPDTNYLFVNNENTGITSGSYKMIALDENNNLYISDSGAGLTSGEYNKLMIRSE